MKEIIMCTNCKNYELMTCNNAHFCDEYGGYVTEDDFCSRGVPIKNKTDESFLASVNLPIKEEKFCELIGLEGYAVKQISKEEYEGESEDTE